MTNSFSFNPSEMPITIIMFDEIQDFEVDLTMCPESNLCHHAVRIMLFQAKTFYDGRIAKDFVVHHMWASTIANMYVDGNMDVPAHFAPKVGRTEINYITINKMNNIIKVYE